jgi:MFS family permease
VSAASKALPPADSSRWPAALLALSIPNYRFYWLGLVLYVLGSRAEFVAYSWLMWELTRDPLALGTLGLAMGTPLVVLQLFGGVLADRTRRLRLLIGTNVAVCVTLAAAFALTAAGLVQVPHLLLLAVLSSIARSLDEPSRLALYPQFVDRERLPNAVALGAIPWQAGRVVGPSLAGLLVAAFGAASGLAMACLASLGALALYGRIRLAEHASAGDGRGVLRQLLGGITFVVGSPLFASLIGMAFANSLFGMSYVMLLPIYADVYFQAGSGGFGLLQAAHGAGAVAGTMLIAAITHRVRRRGRAMLAGATLFGLLLMAFSQAPSLPIALPILVLMGTSATVYLTQISTVLQQSVPDALRGRVMSIYALTWSFLPLGGVLGGGLAALIDARFAVLAGGLIVVATSLLLAVNPRVRNIA